jgi:hypothetical protein
MRVEKLGPVGPVKLEFLGFAKQIFFVLERFLPLVLNNPCRAGSEAGPARAPAGLSSLPKCFLATFHDVVISRAARYP